MLLNDPSHPLCPRDRNGAGYARVGSLGSARGDRPERNSSYLFVATRSRASSP
jgi:hypothetical protein